LAAPPVTSPKYVTSRAAETEAHRFQLIWPYSDFLLHDMGEGLADCQQVGVANGLEWRTPPLWGTGLTQIVNGHSFFLHDGRARNLTEAILCTVARPGLRVTVSPGWRNRTVRTS
jgi:CxxC motif-containing protein (DUF1111 family)